MFDTDRANRRISLMWRKLGALYEGSAYAAIDRGSHETALRAARMAEACYWQATGEMQTVDLGDVVKGAAP